MPKINHNNLILQILKIILIDIKIIKKIQKDIKNEYEKEQKHKLSHINTCGDIENDLVPDLIAVETPEDFDRQNNQQTIVNQCHYAPENETEQLFVVVQVDFYYYYVDEAQHCEQNQPVRNVHLEVYNQDNGNCQEHDETLF